ncbi:TPR and ankyrin repeat-containing protein 1-like [Mizuhopecten yessoensis]|uniref:TPR and ankyrin repeat-containing protein 1 n=1 Tax=Mizuhopecten yessoensis TaxID=6573 RepID=A0A210QK63_MIZYE|nr:TPR and ankyrin repeat-containing protein 1-like [Mizuhopecten yessoensis]OWF49129.1 TPR and ankyrin repeat-containing protein 1 [Mizuhopecten yessoensis]
MITNDNSCRQTTDEHLQRDIICHHTVEVDKQHVSVTSDTPSAGSEEQFDYASIANDDGSEKAGHSHDQSEKGHHDHSEGKLFGSETDPGSLDIPNETQVKRATERKTMGKKIESLFKEGISWLEIKQYNNGFAIFAKLLQSAPALSDEYISKIINRIGTYLEDSDDPDIPEDLIQIPDSHLIQILKGLLDRRKWIPFLSIVRKHRESNASKVTFMELVGEICLEAVVGDPQFLRNTKRLDNLMRSLLDIGATIPNEGKICFQACIKNGHYGILPLLLSKGAHPKHLIIYTGDTPVHAALTIALTKVPGHFEALELLCKKFEEDPQEYNMCDPTAKDRYGDGLLHLALRQSGGSQFGKAIDILSQHIQNPSALNFKNKKGQYPSDCAKGIYSPIPDRPRRQKRKKKIATRRRGEEKNGGERR